MADDGRREVERRQAIIQRWEGPVGGRVSAGMNRRAGYAPLTGRQPPIT
jgi:hypothetical protein